VDYDLLDGFPAHHLRIDRPMLDQLVNAPAKTPVPCDVTGTWVRASQDRSVDVELRLEPQKAPSLLCFDTSETAMPPFVVKG